MKEKNLFPEIVDKPDDLIDFAFTEFSPSIIKVIGVGGGGSNAVNHMFETGIEDVEFVVCNTDSQALANSPVRTKIQLGTGITEGRGAGSDPGVGEQAARENLQDIINVLENNTKMVFITAGMGGGTGTGAAPVIAEEARSRKILTVAIVTIPFKTEVGNRYKQALAGIKKLQTHVDSLIVIDNEQINKNYGDSSFSEAFKEADKILGTAAKAIVQIIKIHGMWNVDFNDVKKVMTDSGVALMGIGVASGADRAVTAVENALKSPLLNNNNIRDAKKILLNIISGTNEILMRETQDICLALQKETGSDQEEFIMGVARDMGLGENICVTVIATGFKSVNPEDYRKPEEPENLIPPVPEEPPVPDETSFQEEIQPEEPVQEDIHPEEPKMKKKKIKDKNQLSLWEKFMESKKIFNEDIN